MTELEINRKLAIAIGWREDQMEQVGRDLYIGVEYFKGMDRKVFDYTDWRVIGPIAQRYKLLVSFKFNTVWREQEVTGREADTPQRAIALAVIGAVK